MRRREAPPENFTCLTRFEGTFRYNFVEFWDASNITYGEFPDFHRIPAMNYEPTSEILTT